MSGHPSKIWFALLSDVLAWQDISLREPESGANMTPAALHGSLRETSYQAFGASAEGRTGISITR